MQRRLLGAVMVGSLLSMLLVGSQTSASPELDVFNDRLAIQVSETGEFNFGAFPDPNTGGVGANSFSLSYHWPGLPGTSMSTLRVEGVDTVLANPSAPPTRSADGLTNTSTYTVGDITVTKTLSLVTNPFSGFQDLGRIAYTVTNNGTGSAGVGVRFMNDVDALCVRVQ